MGFSDSGVSPRVYGAEIRREGAYEAFSGGAKMNRFRAPTKAFLGLNLIYIAFFIVIGLALVLGEADDEVFVLKSFAVAFWVALALSQIYKTQRYFMQYFELKSKD